MEGLVERLGWLLQTVLEIAFLGGIAYIIYRVWKKLKALEED
jgi:hypothetical protein